MTENNWQVTNQTNSPADRPDNSDLLNSMTLRVGMSDAFINKDFAPGYTARAFSDSFIARDVTLLALIDHIKQGRAFTEGTFINNARSDKTFAQSQLIGLDIDEDGRVDKLSEDPFIQQYAFFIGATASSGKPDKDGNIQHKARVLFALDTPVKDAATVRAYKRALIAHMEHINPDPAAKDAARLFFGSTNPNSRTFDNVLPVAVLDELVEDYADILTEEAPRSAEDNARIRERNRAILSDNTKRSRAEKYARAALRSMDSDLSTLQQGGGRYGGRNNTLFVFAARCGNYIAAGMLARHTAEQVLEGAARSAGLTAHEIKSTLRNGIEAGLSTPFDTSRFETSRQRRKKTIDLNATPDEADIFTPQYTPPDIDRDIVLTVDFITKAADKLPDEGVVVLLSDKGTGKSTYGQQLIERVRDRGKVMAVTPFRTLTGSTAQKYRLEHYESLTRSEWLQANGLAITLKSLMHFTEMGKIPAVKILLLDELSKMLEQLGSSIFRKGQATAAMATLKALIRQAEHVLIMDADIGQPEINFLKSIRDDVTVVLNDYNRDAGQATVHADADSLNDAFIAALSDETRNGRPVAYMSNTKSAIDAMATYLESFEYRVLTITSDNSSNIDQAAFLRDPDAIIQDYDAILLSPAAGTGIDIQTRVYAKFLTAAYTPGGKQGAPAAEGCSQLLERARNADSTHVFVQQAEGNAPEDPDYLYRRELDAALRTDAYVTAMTLTDSGIDFSPELKALHRLQCELTARDNASRNRLYENLLNLLARNYELSSADGSTAVHKEAIKDAANRRKEAFDALVLTTEPVDDEALDTIARDPMQDLTLTDHAGNERYHIERFYNQTITESLHKFDRDGKGRAEVRNYATGFLLDEDTLKEMDRDERDSNTPIASRSNFTTRAWLARRFAAAIGLDTLRQGDALTLDAIIEGATDFLTRYADEIETFFKERPDHKSDPWNTTKRFFRRLGIRFKEVRSRDKDAPKQYRLDADRLALVDKLAQQHLQGIEARKQGDEGTETPAALQKTVLEDRDTAFFGDSTPAENPIHPDKTARMLQKTVLEDRKNERLRRAEAILLERLKTAEPVEFIDPTTGEKSWLPC